jgi:hypothetical protein
MLSACSVWFSGRFYVGGLGVIGWVSASEYDRSQPDPLDLASFSLIIDFEYGYVEGHFDSARINDKACVAAGSPTSWKNEW